MQWSDLKQPRPPRQLRQFAAISFVVFGVFAGWRAWDGDTGPLTTAIAMAAVVVGLAGIVWLPFVRLVFTAWMVAAFPIGWVVSRLVLAVVFYLVFTPVALVFRMIGRDALRIRGRARASYWLPYDDTRKPDEYFRQY